jgi:hypothetical protein
MWDWVMARSASSSVKRLPSIRVEKWVERRRARCRNSASAATDNGVCSTTTLAASMAINRWAMSEVIVNEGCQVADMA